MTLLDLPQGQFYDVVTALRGPDFGSSSLKFLFTSRIRYWVRKLFGTTMYGDIRENEPSDVLICYANADAQYYHKLSMYWHYAEHTARALDVLYQYLDDAKEAEFLRWCVVRPQEDWIKYKP